MPKDDWYKLDVFSRPHYFKHVDKIGKITASYRKSLQRKVPFKLF